VRVTAIIPCYGRHAQTLALVPRLLATAGVDDWELVCVVNGDAALAQELQRISHVRIFAAKANVGYWRALKEGTKRTSSQIVCNLANDLLPGHHWLRKALLAYDTLYKDGVGMIGFNDGIRNDQSAHFLIARDMLQRWYGEELWPTYYLHSYGDSEMCDRAKAESKYAIAPFAVMYHDHVFTGAKNDAVYEEGKKSVGQDRAMYEMRKQNNWSLSVDPNRMPQKSG
jgi:GT2 family glycosyltransferase